MGERGFEENESKTAGNGGILYIVEPGDTLYLIGKKFRVPVSSILYANPFADVYRLHTGDELYIPAGGRQKT